MWEWREWRQVAPGEPCPAGLVYSMDLNTGTSRARLPDNLRARLEVLEAARSGGADVRPLAPFPPRPESPPAVIATGGEEERVREAESVEDEEAYEPGESALALMYEDDAGPDVYAGMDVDPANATLLRMPTAVPPPPQGSCEQRHYRFHAAEGAHRHHLTGAGRREAGLLEGALERFEFLHPGRVARERSLVAASPDDGQVRCIQQGDAAVLDHHPGEVRAAEPQENLPLSVRLSVGRLLEEAGLADVHRDGGLYVALWESGTDAWRRELAVRPLTPPALGSHALLVAMHPEGVEVVFGENGTDRLLLTVDSTLLVPTTSSYRLESRGGDPRLLVVVGSRQASGTGHRGPEPRAVPVGEDEAAGHVRGVAEDETSAAEEQEQGPDPGPSEAAEEVDVKAHVEEALARIMAAAGPPPATEAMKERTNAGRAAGRGKLWRKMRDWRSWGRRRRTRWSRRRQGWRTGLGPRWGRCKTAGTGPRGGACGLMPAATPTPSRRCRREYPRISS